MIERADTLGAVRRIEGIDESANVDETAAFELEPWQRALIEAATNPPWTDVDAFARAFMRANGRQRRRGEGMR